MLRTLLCLALLALLLACAVPGATPTTTPPTAAQGTKDPWPECAAVRAWLRDNTPDPTAVEVIEWKERTELTKKTSKTPAASQIMVKYRALNAAGAKQVFLGGFMVVDGRVSSHFDGSASLPP